MITHLLSHHLVGDIRDDQNPAISLKIQNEAEIQDGGQNWKHSEKSIFQPIVSWSPSPRNRNFFKLAIFIDCGNVSIMDRPVKRVKLSKLSVELLLIALVKPVASTDKIMKCQREVWKICIGLTRWMSWPLPRLCEWDLWWTNGSDFSRFFRPTG